MARLIKKIAIWLIRDELEKIREKALLAGIRKGDESGYARGFKEGRQTGYDEGKSVFILEDARTVNINPTIDNSIYGPRKFRVSHDLSEQMKEAVATAVSGGSISPPTQAQWAVRPSRHMCGGRRRIRKIDHTGITCCFYALLSQYSIE